MLFACHYLSHSFIIHCELSVLEGWVCKDTEADIYYLLSHSHNLSITSLFLFSFLEVDTYYVVLTPNNWSEETRNSARRCSPVYLANMIVTKLLYHTLFPLLFFHSSSFFSYFISWPSANILLCGDKWQPPVVARTGPHPLAHLSRLSHRIWTIDLLVSQERRNSNKPQFLVRLTQAKTLPGVIN